MSQNHIVDLNNLTRYPPRPKRLVVLHISLVLLAFIDMDFARRIDCELFTAVVMNEESLIHGS